MWILLLMVLVSPGETMVSNKHFVTLEQCEQMATKAATHFRLKYPGVPFATQCVVDPKPVDA